VFVHEFGGDLRAWEPQVRYFGRSYTCITYNARGYPPSSVPQDDASYSQQRAVDDLRCVLDSLCDGPAHVVGNSMGGFCALHFALQHSEKVRSVVVAGCGYGAAPEGRASFQEESARIADHFAAHGAAQTAEWYAFGPSRLQLLAKDPRGHAEHHSQLAEHDATGSALTMRNVQRLRPSLYEMTDELRACRTPALVIVGDEDDGALDASVMLKRQIATAGLCVMPNTGHLTNLEEPAAFNRAVADLFAAAEAGKWPVRDPRSVSASVTGA